MIGRYVRGGRIWLLTAPIAVILLVLPGGLGASSIPPTHGSRVGGPVPVTPLVPPPRWVAPMADDAKDGYVVLFGGSSGRHTLYNDTWTYGAGTWQNLSPAVSPSARSSDSLVYDGADHYVLLFGGSGSGSADLNDTWKFSAGAWTQLHPTLAPSPRFGAGIAYDAKDGYVVLFGGNNASGVLNDTWKFVHGQWSRLAPSSTPPGRRAMGMAYDAHDGDVVVFGGYGPIGDLSDTWTFTAGSWTRLAVTKFPSARVAPGMAYDAARGEIVLYGGRNDSNLGGNTRLDSDTWTFRSGAWTHRHPTVVPGPREGPGVAWDLNDGYLLMFGGGTRPASHPTGTSATEYWSHGNWS